MFNDSIRGISVYSYALLNSVSDFIESHTYDEESDPNKMNFVSKNGDVYLPMNVPGGKVLNEWAVPNDQVAPQFGDFRTFRQDMLDQDVLSFPFNKGISYWLYDKPRAPTNCLYDFCWFDGVTHKWKNTRI